MSPPAEKFLHFDHKNYKLLSMSPLMSPTLLKIFVVYKFRLVPRPNIGHATALGSENRYYSLWYRGALADVCRKFWRIWKAPECEVSDICLRGTTKCLADLCCRASSYRACSVRTNRTTTLFLPVCHTHLRILNDALFDKLLDSALLYFTSFS